MNRSVILKVDFIVLNVSTFGIGKKNDAFIENKPSQAFKTLEKVDSILEL
jgi:hypothetical protein